jgi:transcriptional regulator with XRE-family HTH domain
MLSENDDVKLFIGKRLTALRQQRKLTQQQLAIKTNQKKSTIAKREVEGVLSTPVLWKHFVALDVNPEEEFKRIFELLKRN